MLVWIVLPVVGWGVIRSSRSKLSIVWLYLILVPVGYVVLVTSDTIRVAENNANARQYQRIPEPRLRAEGTTAVAEQALIEADQDTWDSEMALGMGPLITAVWYGFVLILLGSLRFFYRATTRNKKSALA